MKKKMAEVTGKKVRRTRCKVIEEVGNDELDLSNIFDLDGSEVYCSISRTIQPVQFESFKVEVGVKLPCTIESIQNKSAFKKVFEICRSEVIEQLDKGV